MTTRHTQSQAGDAQGVNAECLCRRTQGRDLRIARLNPWQGVLNVSQAIRIKTHIGQDRCPPLIRRRWARKQVASNDIGGRQLTQVKPDAKTVLQGVTERRLVVGGLVQRNHAKCGAHGRGGMICAV